MKALIPICVLAFALAVPPQTFARHRHHSYHHTVSHHYHHHHHGYYHDGVWYDSYNDWYYGPRQDISVTVPGVGSYHQSKW
jgi:hypothetical protein